MKRVKREEMVIMAACQQTKLPFGITVQRQEKNYVFTWAFRLNATSAKHEGFDKNKISGSIYNAEDYPGCPHCGATSWFKCGGCGKVVCMRPEQTYTRCPVCGHAGEVVTVDEFELSGGDL